MPKFKLFFILSLFLASSLACRAATGLVAPESTPAPVTEATIAPLPTTTPVMEQEQPLPVEPTAAPEADLAPTELIPGDLENELPGFPLLPMGTPYTDDSYKSVPILPGARDASENADTLTFFADQSTDEVLDYYQKVMPEDGWQLLGGDTENPAGRMLIYTKGDQMVTIAIMPDPTSGEGTMVIIAVP